MVGDIVRADGQLYEVTWDGAEAGRDRREPMLVSDDPARSAPLRSAILAALANGVELTQQGIAVRARRSRSGVSAELGLLRQQGLVTAVQYGSSGPTLWRRVPHVC